MKFIISTPTRNHLASKKFFEQAGFSLTEKDDKIYFSDGPITIEIDEALTSRPSIKMYGKFDSSFIEKLKMYGAVLEKEHFYLITDPSGTWVYFMKNVDIPVENEGSESQSIFGKYAGISIESVDMNKTISFYELLGFKTTMGSVDAGWISMSSEAGYSISIMLALNCPHMFSNPSLTYFNSGNNLENIEKIRKAGIPISEEITVFNDKNIVDNVVVHDPGGIGFFVFND